MSTGMIHLLRQFLEGELSDGKVTKVTKVICFRNREQGARPRGEMFRKVTRHPHWCLKGQPLSGMKLLAGVHDANAFV
jgi:hypothetical protein